MKTSFAWSQLLTFIMILFICGSCERKDEIAIGAKYAGGIIIFIDETGQHGLVAATTDQGNYQWGCVFDSVPGANSHQIGSGLQNTTDIINYCHEPDIAASVCEKLELNGYSDWFLPSIDELHLMYINLKLRNIGGMISKFRFLWYESEAYYMSSTQYDRISNWRQNFNTGQKTNGFSKNYSAFVRAVRAF